MIGKRHRVEFKKAGLSGLFHWHALATAFLIVAASLRPE